MSAEFRTCSCGASFVAAHGNQKLCPDCQRLKYEPKWKPLPLVCECGTTFTPTHHNQRQCVPCRNRRDAEWFADEWQQPSVGSEDAVTLMFAMSQRDVLEREWEDGEAAIRVALRDGVTGLSHHEVPFAAEIRRLEMQADAKHFGVELADAAVSEDGNWPLRFRPMRKRRPLVHVSPDVFDMLVEAVVSLAS